MRPRGKRGFFMPKTRKERALRIAYMGVMTALTVVLIALLHFPVFPAVAFLEYDPGDIPLLICGFMLGPIPGMIVTLLACAIQAFLLGGNGIYGFIMHLLASGTLVALSSLIYRKRHTRGGAAIALACGAAAWVLVMIPANLFITPYFMGAPVEAVTALLPYILAFNAIKAFGNSAVVFLIYKPLRRYLNPEFRLMR